MIQRIPALTTLCGLFARQDPRQQASVALARLCSQFDLEALPFNEGVQESRRNDETRHIAVGVWLVPLKGHQNPDTANMDKAIPAATCDLRRQGIGVLMPVELQSKSFIVAVADMDNVWRFFIAGVRHQSARPGGWFQLGLGIERIWEPATLQANAFRHRIENAFKD